MRKLKLHHLKAIVIRLWNLFKFELERFILGGPFNRLLVIAMLIGSVSLAAGLLAYLTTPRFSAAPEAIWWAFLRLTDPGYLGDDQGTILRFISTIVTVLGYVLFLGALIAIMTQWLNQTLARLQSGLTPIAEDDHVVILGWTNRTATIVRQLMLSEERVKRFLKRHGVADLHIVLLVEEVTPALVQELRDRLGPLWNSRQITFRSGSPLRIEHLHRVDFLNAAVIILPAGSERESERTVSPDGRTIKTLLSMASASRNNNNAPLPLTVTELFDPQRTAIAHRAYGGPIEILASNLFISRLIVQNVRHRGISHVYSELLNHEEGNEIYVRDFPALTGLNFYDLQDAFPAATLLGVVRRQNNDFVPLLNPPLDFVVTDQDRIVLIASSFKGSEPVADYQPPPEDRRKPIDPLPPKTQPARQVLILGWNYKIPATILEFDSFTNEPSEIDILSRAPLAERAAALQRSNVDPTHVKVNQIVGNHTALADLKRLNPAKYHNVVMLASQRLESEIESDARTFLTYLTLQEALTGASSRPEMLIELVDPANASLFHSPRDELLISPMVLSHMLTQVALRRESEVVFDDLFGSGGAEIFFRQASTYGLSGQTFNFEEIQEAVLKRGEIALGLRIQAKLNNPQGGIVLNPDKERLWRLTGTDEVVVLADYED